MPFHCPHCNGPIEDTELRSYIGRQNGRKGGRARSPAKRKAARANGRARWKRKKQEQSKPEEKTDHWTETDCYFTNKPWPEEITCEKFEGDPTTTADTVEWPHKGEWK